MTDRGVRTVLLSLVVAGVFALGGRPAHADVPVAPPAGKALFIENISVADPGRTGILANQSILIRDGEIVAMGHRDAIKKPRGADKFDGKGKFLIPGLVDMHVHLGELSDTYSTLLVVNGVTRVRDMGGDIWRISDIRKRIASGELVGPDITAAGPILENRRWLTIVRGMRAEHGGELLHRIPIGSASEARDVLDIVSPLGMDFVKIRNAPPPHVYRAIAEGTSAHGMKLVGHEPMVVGLAEAFETGQMSIEHVPWMSLTLPGRNPSGEDIEMIADAALAHGIYLSPTIVAMQGRLFTSDELRAQLDNPDETMPINYISASHIQRWRDDLDERDGETGDLPWDEMIEKSLGYLREFHNAGVPIMTGTDLGPIFVFPGWSVHQEMAFLVEDAGLTPKEALQAATQRPAEFEGLDREGRIGVGMRANLVVLDKDPFADIMNTRSISAVVHRGRLIDSEVRAELLAWAEANKDSESDYERTIDANTAAFQSRPTSENAATLGRYYFAQGDYALSREYFTQARDLTDDNAAFTRELFTTVSNELYENEGDCTVLHPLADLLLEGADASETLAIASRATEVARVRECGDTQDRYLRVVGTLDVENLPPESMSTYHEVMVNYMKRVEHDDASALAHKKALLPEGWETSPRQLNGLAWWCFETTTALPEAKVLAEEAIAKAPNDGNKANALDTLAEIENALGNPTKAAELMESAIELNRTEYFEKQLIRFRELAAQ